MVSLEPDGHHPGGGTCWTNNKLFIETFVATILGIVAFKLFYFSHHRVTVGDALLF